MLPEPESELLNIINAPVAPKARAQRDVLLAKHERTEEEQAALLRLIDEVEIKNAKRWQAVAELTQGALPESVTKML